MVKVTKNDQEYPFSKGIMARSISKSGISVDRSYELVNQIFEEIKRKNYEKVSSDTLVKIITDKLVEQGNELEVKYFRVCRNLRHLNKPTFIFIGGGAGVGKSTISSALGHRLGINRVIGTDTIREIMRGILSPELAPALYHSSFIPSEVNTAFVNNKLIYSFEQQIRLVAEGIKSVLLRSIKEGLKVIVNGVHIVPSFVFSDKIKKKDFYLFQYILSIPDVEQHIQNFYSREENSLRSPQRYANKIDNIRKIQDYINKRAEEQDVTIIQNRNFDETMKIILNDISNKIEKGL